MNKSRKRMYILYDCDFGRETNVEKMSDQEANRRNALFRSCGEPFRWLPADELEIRE